VKKTIIGLLMVAIMMVALSAAGWTATTSGQEADVTLGSVLWIQCGSQLIDIPIEPTFFPPGPPGGHGSGTFYVGDADNTILYRANVLAKVTAEATQKWDKIGSGIGDFPLLLQIEDIDEAYQTLLDSAGQMTGPQTLLTDFTGDDSHNYAYYAEADPAGVTPGTYKTFVEFTIIAQ
jgi:hypothetical protein